VAPVAVFFQELLAAGKAAATVRSYGMDLLRWWRFLHAVEVLWDRATQPAERQPGHAGSRRSFRTRRHG
jgi:hypothetical protein